MQRLLISLCNLPPESREPALLAVDPDAKTATPVTLPDDDLISATGLDANERFVYVVTESVRGCCAVTLERKTLAILAISHLRGALDPHAIAIHGERLFVTSTGTNSLIEHVLHDVGVVNPRLAWTANASYSDVVHLNGVAVAADGTVVCTGFGPRHDGGWAESDNGFVMNVTKRELVETGVKHPHTPKFLNGELFYLASFRAELRSPGRIWGTLAGYTRGMALLADGTAWIGTSRARRPGPTPLLSDRVCEIVHVDIRSGTVLDAIALETGGEIFDVLALDD